MAASLLQLSNGLSAELLRKFIEDLHAKGNEKLIGTFKGCLEERQVTTKSAGIYMDRLDQIYVLLSQYLDIPINIYTPIDANKDKLVVYFHGGGQITRKY